MASGSRTILDRGVMTTVHGYSTFVSDAESRRTLEVSTISLDALADSDLADLIRKGRDPGVAGVLAEIGSGIDGSTLDVRLVESFGFERFSGRLAAVVDSQYIDQAEKAWEAPLEPESPGTLLADQLLRATVLVEQSKATEISVAGLVAAAAVHTMGTVVVAVIHTGTVSGGLVLFLSPLGLIAVGVGTAVLIHLLMTKRRQQ